MTVWRACRRVVVVGAALLLGAAASEAADITIDTSTRYQTIAGFGTCLAWWVNNPADSVYYTANFRNNYARDLGFNILRVEMHPSVLMGPGNILSSPVALDDDLATNIGKFNFAKPQSRVFGDLAEYLRDNVLEPGSFKLVGALWTPPHWLKGPNGTMYGQTPAPACGTDEYNSCGGRLLQDDASKTQFARYVGGYVRGFEQYHGVTWSAVSLQNELIYETGYNSANYRKDQNGNVDQFWQYADALRSVADYFSAKGISTPIFGPHHAGIAGRPGNPWHFYEQMGFIDAVRNHASGNLMDSLGMFASNDYADEGLVNHAVMLDAYWQGTANVAANWTPDAPEGNISQYGKENWFQETSGEGPTWDKDNALGLAQKIHDGLVQGHASAYIYWQTADGNADVSSATLLGNNQMANPTSSKKYCAVKHFSRYIRPGSQRVKATFDANGWSSYGGASPDDTYNSLDVSAYVRDNDLTVVLVNMLASDQPTTLNIPSSLGISSFQNWRTTASEGFAQQADLQVLSDAVTVSVPALSVVTLYGHGAGVGGGYTLSVGRSGNGSGSVSSAPGGIDCGTICSAAYAGGTSVTLAPAAAPGSAFAGWTGACAGTGACTLTMSSDQSATATFAAVGVTRTTYGNNGNPWAIGASGPTRIQAENFDTGGEGVAYHDADPANQGGQYRSGEGVDLESASGGGYDVGWVVGGEWLEYTVNVAVGGVYDLKLHVARQPSGSSAVQVLFGGVDKTGSVAVPSTGGWQSWTDITKTGVTLAAGQQVMRIAMLGADFNVDWIEITPSAAPSCPTYGNNGNCWAIGATGASRIQAENFDTGGEGVAYHDSDPANQGGQYRPGEGVDLEVASGGGFNVGWVVGGEWLQYTVSVATAGSYDLKLHVARQPAGSSAVQVLFGGVDKTGSLTVPSTGGWQNWTDVTKTGVSLAAGQQVIRIAMLGSELNLDWIEVTPSAAASCPTYGNNGNCWVIGSGGPSRIQAENFDSGGEGVAYHDSDPTNQGGQYRPTDGVDLETASGGGYDVAWVSPGEWLQYTVSVAVAGTYDLKLHVARQPTGTSAVQVLFGGVDKTGSLTVPSTGGWQNWADVTKTGISLAAGQQVLRINMVGGDFNLDWIELTPTAASSCPTYGNGGNCWAIVSAGPTRVQAENFDTGGEGVAYHDSDPTNNNGQYRPNEGVDIETTVGGGYDVGWVVAGEWLQYTVNVTAAGTYALKLHVSRKPAGNSSVQVLFGGVDETGSLAVPSTGAWQTWTDVTKAGVSLAAGQQVLRINMVGGDFNLDWIEITPTP